MKAPGKICMLIRRWLRIPKEDQSLSRRDEIALQAMVGVVGSGGAFYQTCVDDEDFELVAGVCYRMADAMLAVLAQSGDGK